MLSVIYLLAVAGASDQAVPHVKPAPPPAPVAQIYAPPAPPPSPYYAPPPSGPNRLPIPKGNPGSWVSSDDYPTSALRSGKSGAVAFTLDINKWGSVADCSITASSGDADLDEATCRNVAIRARFYPATDKDAKSIAGKYSNRVRWQIPNDIPQPIASEETSYARPQYVPSQQFPRAPYLTSYGWNYPKAADYPTKAEMEGRSGTTYVDLFIDSSGAVSDCKVTATSGHVDLDQKSCEIAKERAKFSPAYDVLGQPGIGRSSTGVVWALAQANQNIASSNYIASPPPSTPIKRPQLFKEAGFAEVEFLVRADGSIGECTEAGDLIKKMGENGKACDITKPMSGKFEPYLDASGKPVAKKVKLRMSVDLTETK
jgi:TonB family protein